MLCQECKTEFFPKAYNAKYCSKKCCDKVKHRKFRATKIWDRDCPICNSAFKATHAKRRMCSDSCRKQSFSRKRKKFLDIPSCLADASRKLDKNLGYVRIYTPMHPEANTWGYCYEHRIIAEQMIGRRLFKDEIVHHKNGKRWDNRPENLEVMNKSDHSKLHGQRPEDCTS